MIVLEFWILQLNKVSLKTLLSLATCSWLAADQIHHDAIFLSQDEDATQLPLRESEACQPHLCSSKWWCWNWRARMDARTPDGADLHRVNCTWPHLSSSGLGRQGVRYSFWFSNARNLLPHDCTSSHFLFFPVADISKLLQLLILAAEYKHQQLRPF